MNTKICIAGLNRRAGYATAYYHNLSAIFLSVIIGMEEKLSLSAHVIHRHNVLLKFSLRLHKLLKELESFTHLL